MIDGGLHQRSIASCNHSVRRQSIIQSNTERQRNVGNVHHRGQIGLVYARERNHVEKMPHVTNRFSSADGSPTMAAHRLGASPMHATDGGVAAPK